MAVCIFWEWVSKNDWRIKWKGSWKKLGDEMNYSRSILNMELSEAGTEMIEWHMGKNEKWGEGWSRLRKKGIKGWSLGKS